MKSWKNIFKIYLKQIPHLTRLAPAPIGAGPSLSLCGSLGKVRNDNSISCFLFPVSIVGFTLAEVLITLGIIGIVAAMTIPVLMNYFQEQALLTQFNKVYSVIAQAYANAAQDNLTADHWADQQTIYNNLKPYFKIAQDCGNGYGCFPHVNYKGLKGDASGPDLYGTGGTIWYKLRLADGASISTNGILRTLFVDINGDKGPNTIGVDLFFLYLNTKSGAPYVSWAINTISLENCSKLLDDTWYDGGSCSYWVIKHRNMDYLHRDLSTTEWNN